MKQFPILEMHKQDQPIGFAQVIGDDLVLTFRPDAKMTSERMPVQAWRSIESQREPDGTVIILRAAVLYLSTELPK